MKKLFHQGREIHYREPWGSPGWITYLKGNRYPLDISEAEFVQRMLLEQRIGLGSLGTFRYADNPEREVSIPYRDIQIVETDVPSYPIVVRKR